MNIRSIIIDDEPNNVENLQIILQKYCEGITVVATATTGTTGMDMIQLHQPDLVFLDIQMPGMSGFELLRALPAIDFEIIFVTAFDQYGIQAIKFLALDYLLKPVNVEELKSAVTKAQTRVSKKQHNQKIESLLELIRKEPNHIPKISLPTFDGTLYVKVNEIIRCEASNNYTRVYLFSGEHVLVAKTLKDFAELLTSHGFIRSHQSHLANPEFIKGYLKQDGGLLLMKDGTKLPISRQNRDRIKDALNHTHR